MNYEAFERDFLLQLVDAASRPESRGFAEVAIEGPTGHLEDAALKTFERESLIEIASSLLNGRVRVKLTGKGYRAAEGIRTNLAAPKRESHPIGFVGSSSKS